MIAASMNEPESLEMPPEMRRETGSMKWLKTEMLEATSPGLEINLDFKLEGGSARVPRKGLETISRTTIFDNNLCRSPG